MKDLLRKILIKINPSYRKLYFFEKQFANTGETINNIDIKTNALNTISGTLEDIDLKICIIQNILKYDGCILLLDEIAKEESSRDEKADGVIEDYIHMQKTYYEDVTTASDKIVGSQVPPAEPGA
jgi:hypothetical protein